MGCGISQRGPTVVEVQRPLAHRQRPPHGAAAQSSQRAPADEVSVPRRSHSSRLAGSGGERQVARFGARRFLVGDTITSRVPQNIQDHAFCFECGIFFYAGNGQSPQCSQCGSSFVQFLRATQDSNWITTDNPIAQGFSFDDQLENSISASLAETPIPKKPTQKSFLASLKLSQLDKVEVESRSRLDASDPRSNCAICRDSFVVGDSVYKLPCNHTFHAGCILLWLKGNNTCPICRLQLPEAVDGEDEPEILGSKNPAHDAAAESDEGESSDKEARPLTPPASEAPRGNDAAAEASASDEETSTDVVIKDVSGEPSAGQRGHSPCNLPGALEDDDADQPDLQGYEADQERLRTAGGVVPPVQ